MFWQYQTISQGTNSIIEQLKADPNISDPSDYIVFFSLRAHALMPNNQPATEMIYIHSKLIIVDDQSVLIGSANINDRSLRGLRDSEIAMVTQDVNKIQSKMNQQPYEVAKFAHTLRKSLFQEHFALTEQEVVDPLSDKLSETIKERIQKNTQIYREIFHCYPDSEIKTYDDMNQALKMQPSVENYQNLSGQIQGFGVEYPLYFLEKENLRPYFTQKEFYVPICFT